MANLKAAQQLASEAGSHLVFVRPPISWPLLEANTGTEYAKLTSRWNHRLFLEVQALSSALDFTVLDAHGWVLSSRLRSDHFCDGVHMSREGHRLVATGLSQMAKEKGLF